VEDWTRVESTDDPRWTEFRTEVERVTKGRPLEKLAVPTPDGLGIEPVYIRSDRPPGTELGWTSVRNAAPRWEIRIPVLSADPATANASVLDELARGAEGLLLVLAPRARGADRAWPGGIQLERRSDLERLLRDVHLEMISVSFDAGVAAVPAAASLLSLADRAGVTDQLTGCLGLDWTTARARLGALPAPQSDLDRLTASFLERTPDGLRVARIDGATWAEGGASADQQIAAMLAGAVETWRAWAEAGVDPASAPARTELRVSLGSDVLESVALVRALRRTFARVCEVVGASSPPFVEGVPSRSMLTRWDVHTNLLRLTTAAAAGAMAGVDALVAVPFDWALGPPAELSRRLARNLQHILREESHLGHVLDPAGGSHYIEARTEALASAAWSRFRRFEAEGGLSVALETGRWQDEIRVRREARFAEVARRRAPIVGVSVFPNAQEEGADVEGPGTSVVDGPSFALPKLGPPDEIRAHVDRDEPWFEPRAGSRSDSIPAVPHVRWAADFEGFRDRARSLKQRGERAPRALLANLGRRADFSARSTWTYNLLVAGGFDVVDSDGFVEPDAAARAAVESEADVIFLCGSDAAYAESGAAFARALVGDGRDVFLAGALLPELEDAPLAGVVTAKDDALAFLGQLWARYEGGSK
jgi:methylmalonyl-CoA mutase